MGMHKDAYLMSDFEKALRELLELGWIEIVDGKIVWLPMEEGEDG